VRKVNKSELEKIAARGGKVETMPRHVAMPGLEAIMQHFHEMKVEQAEGHEKAQAAKLKKMDQLIKALGNQDLADAMKRLCEIQNAMLEMKQKHEAKEDDDHEPCAYVLTFERDRRGYIDGTKGIRFTPVADDA
jgi:hypothetical protein